MRERSEQLHATLWNLLGVVIVLSVGTVLCFSAFLRHQSVFAAFNDDFFYYLQIARNLAMHGQSSFNGLYPTNGYHPLWMMVLVVLYKLAPGKNIFYGVEAFTVMMGLATYLLARRILLRYSGDAALSAAFAAGIACTTFIFRTGMEVTIAIPALFLLLAYRMRPQFTFVRRQALLYGLLGSIAVLARFDNGIFIGLLVAADITAFGWRRVLRQLPWMALGALPLFVYLASNLLIFHTLMPVSGMAKELRIHHTPSLYAWRHIFVSTLDTRVLVVGGALAECALLGLLIFLSQRIDGDASARLDRRESVTRVLWAVALFPLIFFAIESVVSDWPLFLWYLYSVPLLFFALALCVLRVLNSSSAPLRKLALPVAAVALCLVIGQYTLSIARFGGWPMSEVIPLDQQVAAFAAAHPGIYAIGDRAGLVGYLSPRPVIQLEGLVMDKAFLANINAQSELHTVLQKYHVRYYIVSGYGESMHADGCYDAAESDVSGSDSKTMRGRFCNPVVGFVENHRVFVIFDLARGS